MCDSMIDYPELIEHFKSQMKFRTHTNYGTDEDMEMGHSWTTIRIDQKPKLDDIFEACEGCPACMLTVLRACGLCSPEWDMKFNFKSVQEEWWESKKPSYEDIC